MKEYLFGAVYIIEPDYTPEEMQRDLANMRGSGFNLVTLWPTSNPWIATNSHEHRFDITRQVLDVCHRLGMRAILQLFGQNQAMEFMPDSAQTAEMESVDPYNENCFWANLNHPVVRSYMQDYFRQAISALGDHPALYGWDVFNEAHFRSDDPYTLRLYQGWLETRYGDIRTLNLRWHRRYDSFAQIRPDRRQAAYSVWSSLLPDVEYERFRSENLTEICRFLCETARQYDDRHPLLLDGTSGQILFEQVTYRNCDEFAVARTPDIYGGTFYPKSWGNRYNEAPWALAMYFSLPAQAAKGAGKPYFVSELQTHTQSVLTPGSEVEPVDLTRWILMNVFSGAQAIQLWRWRPFLHGYQSTGRGLTAMDGTPNERCEAAAQALSLIKGSLGEHFRPSPSPVAIAVSYNNRLFFDSLLHWGGSFWAKELEGWYRLFWSAGIAPDIVDLEHLPDALPPVLVLPAMLRVAREDAERLARYVEGGGLLIADGRMGVLDGWAEVPKEGVPGALLSDLFGIREMDVGSGGSFVLDGEAIPAAFQHQRLEVYPGAEVLAAMEDASPAVVRNATGHGQTLYFNAFMGLALAEKLWPQVVSCVLTRMGAAYPLAEKQDCVHLAEGRSDQGDHLLAINFSDEAQAVILHTVPGRTLEGGDPASADKEGTLRLHLAPSEYTIYTWRD